MHSTAAFLSMHKKDGIILGGKTIRGFNENTMRGYPLWLPLTTLQVTDVVMRDEDILCAKGGRHVPDNSQAISDPEENREAIRKVCALRYLDGYPDAKVIDPIKENFPACTMPLSRTSPTYVTPNAELVRQTTMLMDGKSGISINMPCALMPVPEGDAPALMHERLVTSLTGNQPYDNGEEVLHLA